MLSMHYVSIMMRIFYIDWQQHWECDRTMNIGANAHGERTVTTKTTTSDRLVLRWQLSFQWYRRGIELVFKSRDCFTKWLFHSATICFAATYVFVVWNFTSFFLTSIWWGSTQLQCIYYLRRILISRPPRVFLHFKRRSCLSSLFPPFFITPPIC